MNPLSHAAPPCPRQLASGFVHVGDASPGQADKWLCGRPSAGRICSLPSPTPSLPLPGGQRRRKFVVLGKCRHLAGSDFPQVESACDAWEWEVGSNFHQPLISNIAARRTSSPTNRQAKPALRLRGSHHRSVTRCGGMRAMQVRTLREEEEVGNTPRSFKSPFRQEGINRAVFPHRKLMSFFLHVDNALARQISVQCSKATEVGGEGNPIEPVGRPDGKPMPDGYTGQGDRTGLATSDEKGSREVKDREPEHWAAGEGRQMERTGEKELHVHSVHGDPMNESRKGAAASYPVPAVKEANWVNKLTKVLGKALLLAILLGAIAVSAFPSFLSWQRGRKGLLALLNKSIAGTVEVGSLSFGWTKPLRLTELRVKSPNGATVAIVKNMATDASLLSMISSPTSLGGLKVDVPLVDISNDAATGVPQLALALMPSQGVVKDSKGATKAKQKAASQRPAVVDFNMCLQGDGDDGIATVDAKVLMDAEAGEVIGKKALLQGWLGSSAVQESSKLKNLHIGGFLLARSFPVITKFEADVLKAEIAGAANLRSGKFELAQPITCEIRPSKAIAETVLARINPLLGFIVDKEPGSNAEKYPPIKIAVSSAGMVVPSTEYRVHIDPMHVVIAQRNFVRRILNVLSEDQLESDGSDLVMRTSAIDANVYMDGRLVCSRTDVLIADTIHLATWGKVDWINDKIAMILAIPQDTLRHVRGLSKIPRDCALQINLGGSTEDPDVDWGSLARQITELILRQGAGVYGMLLFDNKQLKMPPPTGELPWKAR
ncbi:hypothetical protein CBR_g29392 [Chara braunii]|uniref:Uncharacterized protein n=1 Tax=Chara braunii TaxID=69332 RepID=A0A388JWT4_CHABU|nr:hypothetical protein CBR_g29392 [Chara braunii]|eukprot:GBG62192.1 hypothetical protein CBR_g29392 [Chara braunii]